eukprot:5592775-Amphidinium_carterae.1
MTWSMRLRGQTLQDYQVQHAEQVLRVPPNGASSEPQTIESSTTTSDSTGAWHAAGGWSTFWRWL